jgi:hypothetical protein
MEGRMQWVLTSPHAADVVQELPKEEKEGRVALPAQRRSHPENSNSFRIMFGI